MHFKSTLFGLIALGLALGVGAGAYAQIYTGTIAGRVADQTGAVMPGVMVTISSDVLIRDQTAVTSGSGSYRFAELPIGTYTVQFELAGFKTLIREGVIITAGMTATLNVELGIAELEETVTVSGESPVVDVRQTGIPESFNNDRLENIPTARDPWVILEQTPGVIVDRQNVGGNESGQQSNFAVRGADRSMTTYSYDGVNITDEAAAGSTPMYFDFGAFEEIQINTGGNDASMQTDSAQINFLIKQGTNNWSGQGYLYGTDSALQWGNVSDEQRARGAGAGAPIKYILDYGFDIGGPVIKDRAWIWGDYNIQDIHKGAVGFLIPGCDDPEDAACLNDDPSTLKNNNIKANVQISDNNKFNFLWARNDKTRGTRGASPLRPLETTWKQSGPTNIYKFEDTHIFNDNFLMTARFARVKGGFRLDLQSDDLRDVQTRYEYSTGAYAGSYYFYNTTRPQNIFNVDGNYFATNVAGGDHEFKFGFQYKKADVDSVSGYGGDVVAAFDGGVPVEAWLVRPRVVAYRGTYYALHVQDVFTRDRMTLRLGLRYDYGKSVNLASEAPSNMVAPGYMPAARYGGSEPLDPWKNFSPRVGVTYDLTGDGKTLLRGNYSRYYDKLLSYAATFINPVNWTEVDHPWNDLNGDLQVQPNEIDYDTVYYQSNFDPANPTALSSPNVIDPDWSSRTVDEFILGVEHEMMPDFSLGGTFVYKVFKNLEWDDWYPDSGVVGVDRPMPGITSADFVPTSEEFEGQTFTYYELGVDRPAGDLLTNWPDYTQNYKGIELFARKRFSNRWQMSGGFTWGDVREHFNSERAIFDPTNIDLRDGGQVYAPSEGSGKNGILMNTKWGFRFDGMVQLPADVYLAGKFNARQGFTNPKTFRTASRSGIGRAEVLYNPIGDDRVDTLWYADFRLEKRFRFGAGTELSGMMDIFNLLNSNTVLLSERRQNFSTANNIQEILSGRIIRFGVRFRF